MLDVKIKKLSDENFTTILKNDNDKQKIIKNPLGYFLQHKKAGNANFNKDKSKSLKMI